MLMMIHGVSCCNQTLYVSDLTLTGLRVLCNR